MSVAAGEAGQVLNLLENTASRFGTSLFVVEMMKESIIIGRKKTSVALNIKHPEADRLARAVSNKTGETITEAIITALRERLRRLEGKTTIPSLADEIVAIGDRCAALPELDSRSAEEIIGYDEHGIPR